MILYFLRKLDLKKKAKTLSRYSSGGRPLDPSYGGFNFLYLSAKAQGEIKCSRKVVEGKEENDQIKIDLKTTNRKKKKRTTKSRLVKGNPLLLDVSFMENKLEIKL